MISGFINVNKKIGASSAKEVAIIKRLTGMSCGHMGTLDPMASGVLPVAVGNATRLFDYFLSKSKVYVATFRFGEETDTLDTTGTVVKSGGRIPEREEIVSAIPNLLGEVMQIPPKYSAKNVGGKRGYQLARAGVDFELPPKKVTIKSIELLGAPTPCEYSFKIECGGGTYIRSIARDLAQLVGTYASMNALSRIKSGPFEIENSVTSDSLSKDNIESFLIPCDSVLPFDSIYVDTAQAHRLFNGLGSRGDYADGTYKLYDENKRFYGLASVESGLIKVRTKLC